MNGAKEKTAVTKDDLTLVYEILDQWLGETSVRDKKAIRAWTILNRMLEDELARSYRP